jgi:hypothetical protein
MDLKKYGMRMCTGFISLRMELMVGCCEYGNELLGSEKRQGIS